MTFSTCTSNDFSNSDVTISHKKIHNSLSNHYNKVTINKVTALLPTLVMRKSVLQP